MLNGKAGSKKKSNLGYLNKNDVTFRCLDDFDAVNVVGIMLRIFWGGEFRRGSSIGESLAVSA
jgi:hypothetical protein